MKPDLCEAPDYYNVDDLLSAEHILVRDAWPPMGNTRYIPVSLSEYGQKAEYPKQIIVWISRNRRPLAPIFQKTMVGQVWTRLVTDS